MQNNGIEYINSIDYPTLKPRIDELDSIMEDNADKSLASRKLRYADVDIEGEREQGRLAPDEMYLPQHIIDTNIRREQSAYVQYISQSPRAVILENKLDNSVDLSLLEKDLTSKLRFEGWQLSMFANIDSFQANGYSAMEVVNDESAPGGVSHEHIQYGDFGFTTDTRDIQAVEMTARAYYFTKTRLLALTGDGTKPDSDWDRNQVDKVISASPESTGSNVNIETDTHEKSLYRIKKLMFRVNGTVMVGWACPSACDNWLRKPRSLYIGRRKVVQPTHPLMAMVSKATQAMGMPPQSTEVYETEFPYTIFPYLISENDTITQLKGRVYLDQDVQEGVTSLISSACTQSRRAAGMYFAKDVSDPNDDLLLQKNIFFRTGCLINSKVTAFKLDAPDPSIFGAINSLVSANQNETSQVNFAVNNRKDSRKTAKEISVAQQQATVLSTVQVVLYSISMQKIYTKMTEVIVSRVNCGVIKVSPALIPLYQMPFIVKPSGDADVIEKQQLLQMMLQFWPVASETPFAQLYLIDMVNMMFPQNASKYDNAISQAQQQQSSQQNQMMQQGMQMLQQLGMEIISLKKHPEYFSDVGRIHAYPIVDNYAQRVEQVQEMIQQKQQASKQPQQKRMM